MVLMLRRGWRHKGHRLPEAVAPAYQYVAVVVHQGVAYVSGQIPRAGGQVLVTGKTGAEVNLVQAQRAAEACVLQALAQLKAELGDLGRVSRIGTRVYSATTGD